MFSSAFAFVWLFVSRIRQNYINSLDEILHMDLPKLKLLSFCSFMLFTFP